MEPDHQGDEELTEHVSGRSAFNLALLAILGMYLAACSFVHPIADDFVFARDARAGLWTAWLSEYAGFSGRYASNALVLSAPASWGAAGARAAAAMLIGVPAAVRPVRARVTDTSAAPWHLRAGFRLCMLTMPSLRGHLLGTTPPRRITRRSCWCSRIAFVLRSPARRAWCSIYLFAAIVPLLVVRVQRYDAAAARFLFDLDRLSAGDRAGGSVHTYPESAAVTAARSGGGDVPGNTVRQGL
jgi:hypothetical protein